MDRDDEDWRKRLETEFRLSYADQFRLWLVWPVLEGKVIPHMREILMNLWRDPAYFRGATRATIGILAGLILSGKIVFPEPIEGWAWYLAQLWPAILALPAGQTNRTPSDIKAIAHDPAVIADPRPTP